MNYYNPYFYSLPTASGATSLLSKINFSSIVNGTSKTLNLVNQAIPLFKQMSPVVKNAKTMFKVMNEFKRAETISPTTETNNITNSIEQSYNQETVNETSNYVNSTNQPTFFI